MCISYLLLALREMGRLLVLLFFSLYHSACFKPFDLHGCRHHLLSAAPYDSWLDRGLFSSCASQRALRGLARPWGWHRAFLGSSMEAESCGKGSLLVCFFVLFYLISFPLFW